jgi:peptidoglycan-N-acetylglucosamine deacetylase
MALSFDNDYASDSESAAVILPLLLRYQITVTWAAVGLWVEKYRDLYSRLLEAGHELMNHSWSHPDNSELRPKDRRKFDELNDQEIEEEIRRSHEACLSSLGYRMRGFRAPHFRVHPRTTEILRSLNYDYVSNEHALYSPMMGLPYPRQEGLTEVPLSFIPRRPGRIFETYRIFRSPDGLYADESVFYRDFNQVLHHTAVYGLITCLYLDPCDVRCFTNPPFEEYLKRLRESGVHLLSLGQIADLFSPLRRTSVATKQ